MTENKKRYVVPYPDWQPFTDAVVTIPKMYWDGWSQEQRLSWIARQLHKIAEYTKYMGGEVNITDEMIAQLESEFEQFKETGFLEYYQKQLEAWIYENMPEIMGEAAKMVYFGLNLEGYFVAYIPDSWSDIVFDTGAVYGEDEYGRLILRYDVDASGENVNQRPEDWS